MIPEKQEGVEKRSTNRKTKLEKEVDDILKTDSHYWIKCKQLAALKYGNRPGNWYARHTAKNFFKECDKQERFRTALVRPYLPDMEYDEFCHEFYRTGGPQCHGRNPRGLILKKRLQWYERMTKYLKKKHRNAFREIYIYEKGEKKNIYAWLSKLGTPDSPVGTLRDLWLQNYLRPYRYSAKNQRYVEILDMNLAMFEKDYKTFRRLSGLGPQYLYRKTDPATLQNERPPHAFAKVDDCFIVITEIHYPHPHRRNRHRLAQRFVEISRDGCVVFWKQIKTYQGEYLRKAIREFKKKDEGAVPETKKIFMFEMDGLKINAFVEAGIFWKFQAEKDGKIAHDWNLDMVIAKWYKKHDIEKYYTTKMINADYVKKFGYCMSGVKHFCCLCGLDPAASYSIADIRKTLKEKWGIRLAAYVKELRRIGVLEKGEWRPE